MKTHLRLPLLHKVKFELSTEVVIAHNSFEGRNHVINVTRSSRNISGRRVTHSRP